MTKSDEGVVPKIGATPSSNRPARRSSAQKRPHSFVKLPSSKQFNSKMPPLIRQTTVDVVVAQNNSYFFVKIRFYLKFLATVLAAPLPLEIVNQKEGARTV